MTIMYQDKQIKVIMVGPDLSSRGGMASVAKGYYSAGIHNYCDLVYISTTSPGGTIHKIKDLFRAYRLFCKILPSAQIVHIHVGAGISQGRKSIFVNKARKAGKRIIIHEHRGILATLCQEKGNKYIQSVRDFYSAADKVVVLSEEWAKFFAENICDSYKIAVLHNGVIPPIDPAPSFYSKQVLFLGHLTPVKGPDILIKAISLISDKCPDVKFVFAGDGEVAEYKEMASRLGVAQLCDFTGWVDEDKRDELLRSSSVYCQPSRDEGMPMGLLEAMGYSLPPIATKVGGIPQVIFSSKNGILVESEDATSLSLGLLHLLTSEQDWKRLSESARKTILEDFNCNKTIDRLLCLYAELAEKN